MNSKETSYAECAKPNWIVFVVFESLKPMYYFGVIGNKALDQDCKFTREDRIKLTKNGSYRTLLICVN